MEEFLFGLNEKEEKIKKKCELFLEENFRNSKEKFMKLSIIPTFLFYGIPGSGKTSLANKIYKLLREKYEIEKYYLNMESLLSSNFGESSKNLIKFFEDIEKQIKEHNIRAFIIIDELDSFTLSRTAHDTESIKRVLLTFNKIIDKLINNNNIYNILIIATTNLENEIDFSVKRRFFFKEDFNIFLEENEFKKFFDELLKICNLLEKFSESEKKRIYKEIYENKKISLGVFKQQFAENYIKFLIQEKNEFFK